MSISVKEMQHRFYKQYARKFSIIVPNMYFPNCSSELDLACIRRSGFVDEVEIKLSYSDFLADFKKITTVWANTKCQKINKHEALVAKHLQSNRFSFYVTEEIVTKVEPLIPDYAGLYVYSVNRLGKPFVIEYKKPKLLHRNKLSVLDILKLGIKMGHRYWKKD